MMFSWQIFAIGLALGVLQLGVGVIIGRALPTRWARLEQDKSPDAALIDKLAGRLQGIVTRLSDDVGHHQVRIEQITKDISALQASDTPNLAELVMDNAARIAKINQQLQSRLADAGNKLQEHSEQLDTLSVTVGPMSALLPDDVVNDGVVNTDELDTIDSDLTEICRDLHDRLTKVTTEG